MEWDGRPLLACQWQAWALAMPPMVTAGYDTPAEKAARIRQAMEVIYQQGYADARAYLDHEHGITIEASSA